mmetsp:Transcript_57048/g.163880  ORF Transcript_57048/g.163880 Transcript_57048/m.163880 type:complete len:82 (-) Transcript_57048:70-315(-)
MPPPRSFHGCSNELQCRLWHEFGGDRGVVSGVVGLAPDGRRMQLSAELGQARSLLCRLSAELGQDMASDLSDDSENSRREI